MNTPDVMKIIYILKSTYPKYYQNMGIEDITQMSRAWEFAFEDFTYEQASVGLKVYLANDKNGFPPSPGQIIDCYMKTKTKPEEEVTAAEAWEYVWKAMENLRWDIPELAFNELPKKIQKVIGTANGLREMAMMQSEDLMIGEKARFIREYNAYTERENQYARIPQTVRDRIETKSEYEMRIEVKNDRDAVPEPLEEKDTMEDEAWERVNERLGQLKRKLNG